MKTVTFAAALLAAGALAQPAAFAQAPMSAEEALKLLFDSQDENGNGVLSPREVGKFRELAYFSFDSNGDMMASAEEWLAWDPGFEPVADQIGRLEQFRSAKRELFSMYDVNDDDFVSDAEMKAGFFDQFIKADANEDGVLDRAEHSNFEIIARQLYVMR